jgi:hypothetical protein
MGWYMNRTYLAYIHICAVLKIRFSMQPDVSNYWIIIHTIVLCLHTDWHTETYRITKMLIQILTSSSFLGKNNTFPVIHYSSFYMLIHNNRAYFFAPFFPTKSKTAELPPKPLSILLQFNNLQTLQTTKPRITAYNSLVSVRIAREHSWAREACEHR